MTQRHEQILTIYSFIAGMLLIWLLTPINGYDSPPEEVYAGDTLYEYVSEKFNHNPYLTSVTFKNFPRPYTQDIYCEGYPDSDCFKNLSIVPEKNILLANTGRNSGDGDTIETKGKEILITKPSGRIDRLPLVTDNQLELKKYTQLVQDIVLFGVLAMAGVFITTIFSSKREPAGIMEVNQNGFVHYLTKKILGFRWRMIGIGWVAISIFAVLLLFSESALATSVIIVYATIFFILIPASFTVVFFGMPFLSLTRTPSLFSAVFFSMVAGAWGTAIFYIVQAMIMSGWF